MDDLFPGTAAAATEAEQTAPAEPEAAAPAVELPNYSADLSGIEDLLDEPDYEPDDGDEPIIPAPVAEEDDEYADPEVKRLKSELRKLGKQVEHERRLRQQEGQKQWKAEAQRRFPLCDPDGLTGASRRAVLREAARQHERSEKLLKPIVEAAKAVLAQEKQTVKTEARQQAKEAWGEPVDGPHAPIVEAAEKAEQVDRSKFRNVHDIVRERFRSGLQI